MLQIPQFQLSNEQSKLRAAVHKRASTGAAPRGDQIESSSSWGWDEGDSDQHPLQGSSPKDLSFRQVN